MLVNDTGLPVYSDQDLINLLYTGKDRIFNSLLVNNSTDIEKYNNNASHFGCEPLCMYTDNHDLPMQEIDKLCQSNWYMPDAYKNINLQKFLLEKCKNNIEVNRVKEELQAFEKFSLLNLLRYTIFLVDHMREHKYVWGVGRGSSVASFVLYLIGIHKINPITYNLDWQEFLR